MTSVEWYWIGLGTTALLAAFYGITRYRTSLNPLTMFAAVEIGLFTIFSGIVAVGLTETVEYTSADVIDTIRITFFYICAVTVPFLFRGQGPSRLFGIGLDMLGLSSDSIASRFSFIKMVLLLAGAAASFFALAYLGGGGTLWFTDTREAYQNFRTGAGPFFALTQWLLTFALIYYIWTVRPRALELLLVLFIFCIAVSFLGSKNNILTLLVIGVVYYNFYVKRIRYFPFLIMMSLMIVAILGLLVVQGSYVSMLEALIYFRDYFDTTAQFISRIDEFGFRYGQGWLSSLWFYVPRGLYPDKPYEYGLTLVHEVLFPGAAAMGYTPGILTWSLAYLDFGTLGVIVYGLISGIWQRMAYEYFLINRQKYFAFVLAMQFAIWPVWMFAPLVFVIIWSIGQSIFLRMEWQDIRHTAQECGGTIPADNGRQC